MEISKKVVNVCGLGSTGSSAVLHLLHEFESLSFEEGEVRWIQDPDGLQELCFLLTHNWGWVRSDAYVRRFIKYTNLVGRRFWPWQYGEGLDRQTRGEFFKQRDKFLNSIVSSKHKGHWFYHDYHERSLYQVLIQNLMRILSWWTPEVIFGREWLRNRAILSDMYFVASDTNVYQLAREFFESLYLRFESNEKNWHVFDQLGLPYHFGEFDKIIPNYHQIFVDRDPRDVFLDAKDYNAYPITDNIDDFIRFYKTSRIDVRMYTDSKSNLFIQFEDLIYRKHKTVQKIVDFLDLKVEDWNEGRAFDNRISVRNTKMWERQENKKYLPQIEKIERQLKEYLYDY